MTAITVLVKQKAPHVALPRLGMRLHIPDAGCTRVRKSVRVITDSEQLCLYSYDSCDGPIIGNISKHTPSRFSAPPNEIFCYKPLRPSPPLSIAYLLRRSIPIIFDGVPQHASQHRVLRFANVVHQYPRPDPMLL